MTVTCKPYSSPALSVGDRAGYVFMSLHPWHHAEEGMNDKNDSASQTMMRDGSYR